MIDRLPDVYQSSARLAIQRADENIFGNESSKSETLSQRAHLVISGVFRHENAVHHLQNQGLLDIDATEEQKTEAVERFIKNASIEFDNVSVINRYTGKQGLFSLGLVVTYRDEDPELAYNFTTSIVEDVLSGVRTIADPVANQTEAFLARELDNASQQLTSMGQQIADFKNKNALYLPELHVVAVRQLDELATQILRSKQDITELRRVSAANSSDLAVTNPDALLFSPDGTRIQSAKERLEKLRIELTFAVSRYSSLHPQVVGSSK